MYEYKFDNCFFLIFIFSPYIWLLLLTYVEKCCRFYMRTVTSAVICMTEVINCFFSLMIKVHVSLTSLKIFSVHVNASVLNYYRKQGADTSMSALTVSSDKFFKIIERSPIDGEY